MLRLIDTFEDTRNRDVRIVRTCNERRPIQDYGLQEDSLQHLLKVQQLVGPFKDTNNVNKMPSSLFCQARYKNCLRYPQPQNADVRSIAFTERGTIFTLRNAFALYSYFLTYY